MRAYAAARGVAIEVRRFGATTRTAEDAAREIGTDVARIVKSLVFVADGSPVIALCSGGTRVDEALLAGALGVPAVRRARPDEAKALTGFAIGGVPPVGHDRPLRTVVDESLRRFTSVWCAAGTPHAVCEVELDALLGAIPEADVRDVTD